MKKHTVFMFFLMSILSCKQEKVYEEIKGFERNYKFDIEIEEKLKRDTVPWKFQISAGEYALKGSYKKALLEWEKVIRGREIVFSKKEKDSLNAIFTVVNAKNEIVKSSKETSIVIINEAHHNPLHRVFTKSLLKKLYDNGYKHLGLEALMNGKMKDVSLNDRGYPVKSSGYYTNDPNFSQLVREAKNIGFNVFSYEQTTGFNGKLREIEQAKNIKKVLDKNPNEKILIHCGFDHVLEGEKENWEKAMAGRIKEFTGIDPLTINQTQFSERGSEKYNNPLLKAMGIKESSVLKSKEGEVLGYRRKKSWADIAVFHPNVKEEKGQIIQENSIEYRLNLERINLEFPLMILAFEKEDDILNAVPISIREVDEKELEASIFLPQKKTYTFVVVNKKNKAIKFHETI